MATLLGPLPISLALESGPSRADIGPLPLGEHRIGRAPENEIQLTDIAVSRQHVSAVGSTTAADQTSPPQVRENLLQEFRWNLLGRGYLIGLHQLRCAGRNLNHRTHRIVRPC